MVATVRPAGPWQRAAAYRRRFHIPVIGVTGSSGKTTTKDMLAAILAKRGPVLKTNGNMNCPGPVRRTLLQLKPAHWAAVLELASARRGYVALSSWMARPSIGILTNVGLAHAILLGGPQGVAHEKGALLRALPKTGLALINDDDSGTKRVDLSRVSARIVRYGLTERAEVWATDVRPERDGMAFSAHWGERRLSLWIPAPGEHNVANALAAFAAAVYLGLEDRAIQQGLAGFHRMGSRLQFNHVREGVLLIHDAYNANPLSMSAALQVLRQHGEGRRVAVLGRMGSLGAFTNTAHVELGRDLARGGIDEAILIGSQARNVLRGIREGNGGLSVAVVPTPAAAVAYLRKTLEPPVVVLFKASNNVHLGDAYRQVAKALAAAAGPLAALNGKTPGSKTAAPS